MVARLLASLAIVFAGACATAEHSTNDQTGGPGADGGTDTTHDAMPDACTDSDSDGVCDIADVCAGFPDDADADADTIADGCDQCPGIDDRVDINTNSVPDCLEVQMRTIDLKSVGGNLWRGWHASNSQHTTDNENTLTGEYSGGVYNSYYVFALTGIEASVITSVTLEIQLEHFQSADATETVSLWDVSTPSTTVEMTGQDANILNDLASGTTYGTLSTSAAEVDSVLSVPLAAQAATDATARLGGDFVIGAHLDTAPGWVRFGHTGADATPTVIRISIAYLP